MFVVPHERQPQPALETAIAAAIRQTLSPRFVPDQIVQAPAIPRTLSGKKLEIPIKRLFLGWAADQVINPDLVENPAAIPWYLDQAKAWLARSGPMGRASGRHA